MGYNCQALGRCAHNFRARSRSRAFAPRLENNAPKREVGARAPRRGSFFATLLAQRLRAVRAPSCDRYPRSGTAELYLAQRLASRVEIRELSSLPSFRFVREASDSSGPFGFNYPEGRYRTDRRPDISMLSERSETLPCQDEAIMRENWPCRISLFYPRRFPSPARGRR